MIRLRGRVEYDGRPDRGVRDRLGGLRRVGALRARGTATRSARGAADALDASSSPCTRSASSEGFDVWREPSSASSRAATEAVPPTLPAPSAVAMIELAVALGWSLERRSARSTTSSSRPSSTCSRRAAAPWLEAATTGGLSLEMEGIFETLKAVRARRGRPPPGRQQRAPRRRRARAARARRRAPGLRRARAVSRSRRGSRARLGSSATASRSSRSAARRGSAGSGAPAGALVWGSEQGPKGAVNHWGVPPCAGYWIAPAVERAGPKAVDRFRRAVADVFRRTGSSRWPARGTS